MNPQLILASASPRRRELLQLLGLPFSVRSVEIDETPRADEAPEILVARLSGTKAATVCNQLDRESNLPEGTLVIAADTVVVLDGDLLGKPATPAEAIDMLTRLGGRSHWVHTAVSVVELPSRRATIRLSSSTVWMRDYDEEEIQAYVRSGDPMDKAGAYAIQHAGFHPVSRLQGCYTGVVGLPLKALVLGLNHFGVQPDIDVAAACSGWTGQSCCYVSEDIVLETVGDE